MSGPVPKRSTQRRRTNSKKPQQVTVAAPLVAQPPLRDGLCEQATGWYVSLAASGQSRFYEPSDWAAAQLLAEAIHAFVEDRNAALLRTILSGFGTLLVTEGDRRRLQLELSRVDEAAVSADAAAEATIHELRGRLASS